MVFAQAPNINYASPQNYTVKTTISPLQPSNSGGAVIAGLTGPVITFAGNLNPGANNAQGATATFYGPYGVAADAAGNIYVADTYNNLIRKIDAYGQVTTLAGSGATGSSDGMGANASFNYPSGMALDAAGNIYVSDTFNNLIRKVTAAGLVTTIAGDGPAGLKDGVGNAASFRLPDGLTLDGTGNIYVADQSDNAIRKITPAGMVTTFAGSGAFGAADGMGGAVSFQNPTGITIDASGNLYVADQENLLIRKITPAGTVSTIAGKFAVNGANDGQGSNASFNFPYGLVADASGNLYVADSENNEIRKIDQNDNVTTFAGNTLAGNQDGPLLNATFRQLTGLTIEKKGDIFIADRANNEIREIVITGYTINKPLPPGLTFDPTTGIITGTPTAASPATDYTVTAYNAGGSSSTIVNIDVENSTLAIPPPLISYKSPQTYTQNTTIAPLSPTNTGGAVPAAVYATVSTFAGNKVAGSANGTGTAASFHSPIGAAADAAGNIYIGDDVNSLVRKITPAGVVTTLAGNGKQGYMEGNGISASFDAPFGVAVDGAGSVYVADEGNNMIRKIDPTGNVTTFAGSGAVGSGDGIAAVATFNHPYAVAVDGAGNVYVADGANNLIRKITPAGVVTTLAGSGSIGSADGTGVAASFRDPEGIAVDAAGNVYVCDSANNLIRKITPGGTVTTIAGSGATGSANGTGNLATFNYPFGLTVDGIGNIYVVDQLSNIIRKITPAGIVTTLAGSGIVGSADGIGTAAGFNIPADITIDASGNLYLADGYNNEIRKIITTGYTIDKSLPPGLTFDPTTGIISGTPTASSPATNYTITAYNTAGSSTTNVNITVSDAATITFNPIPPKTVCDPDFDPGATVVTPVTILNPPIIYTSSNTEVATIVAGKIHITGSGTSIITATEGTLSAVQTLTVSAAVVPTITISPVAIDTCQGSAATYTAVITNGGTNPVYQWQVNGQNNGTNSPQFTGSNLNDNDKITCTLTSNALCTKNATATSNVALFNIYQQVPASITIISTAPGSICAGTEVDFIATASTPDNNPAYQWQVNGINAGTNSQTFGSTNLSGGDVVTCILISNAKCLVNPDALSNAITISLSPPSACIISIPNTFTPNGDGINDLWNITALQGYPACTVNIYNRYGTLVYNSIGYPKAWDGDYNGNALPVGTYYYIIDLKNGKKKLTGPITILR